MIILCNTSLPSDRVHAIPADISKIIMPLLVIDRVKEVDVAPVLTIASTDTNIMFRVFKILYLFFDIWFLPLKYVILFLTLIFELLKLFTSFYFFSSLCSKSSFSSGADGFNLGVFFI